MTAPEPGRLVVWSDLGCPWAHVAVVRLRRARAAAGLDGRLVLDHRAFALEHVNRRPTPKRLLDTEIPVAAGLEPEARWQPWRRPDWEYPVTTLPAMEAVQAAKLQSLAASEELDAALRVAWYGESRCISLRHVILDVADARPGVDATALAAALDDGSARRSLMDQVEASAGGAVQGSPHLFLPDGSDVHNPGLTVHWTDDKGRGFPVIESDDPGVYDTIVRGSAGPARAAS